MAFGDVAKDNMAKARELANPGCRICRGKGYLVYVISGGTRAGEFCPCVKKALEEKAREDHKQG